MVEQSSKLPTARPCLDPEEESYNSTPQQQFKGNFPGGGWSGISTCSTTSGSQWKIYTSTPPLFELVPAFPIAPPDYSSSSSGSTSPKLHRSAKRRRTLCVTGSSSSARNDTQPDLIYPSLVPSWGGREWPATPEWYTETETAWALQRLHALRGYDGCYYDSATTSATATAISIFDMVELVVTCPSLGNFLGQEFSSLINGTEDYASVVSRQQFLDPFLRFNRRIGVHAGITLYNLHRVLCYCFAYDEDKSEIPLHIWSVPNSSLQYANGHVFREEARKFKTLMTDKTVALSDLLPNENWSGYQFQYTLGDLGFNIMISDLLKGQTAQQDLLWVPRLCEGSYGNAPPSCLVNNKSFTKLLQRFALTQQQQQQPKSRPNKYDSSSACHPKDLYDELVREALRQSPFEIDSVNRLLNSVRRRMVSLGEVLVITRRQSHRDNSNQPTDSGVLVAHRLSSLSSREIKNSSPRIGRSLSAPDQSMNFHQRVFSQPHTWECSKSTLTKQTSVLDEQVGLLVAKLPVNSFQRIPTLNAVDLQSPEALELVKKKISVSRDIVFDFKATCSNLWPEEKEAKRRNLADVLEYVSSPIERRAATLDLIAEDVIAMVSTNIFRPLPPPVKFSGFIPTDPEDLEPSFDNSWPHLQLVYEILLRIIITTEIAPKLARKHIDQIFLLKLLDLFASQDPRERDFLKSIVHRIYGKIMALRAYIRRAIQNIFLKYIHEDESENGISELLEILGSIINGFAHPIKEEHKIFLKRYMLPLHKSRHVVTYNQQLSYCMIQYIEKDPRLAEPIINGLLRYWPVTNTPKEVLFLNEVEEILELTSETEFQKIMDPLFRRLALCIMSPHFQVIVGFSISMARQVSERALYLWNNNRIVKLVNQNKNRLFPILIHALDQNTQSHWNVAVCGLAFNVLKVLAEADPHLFEHCNEENIARRERKIQEEDSRRDQWNLLKALQEKKKE